MKTGRDVHVPKSDEMKRNYRRYIETLDYQPTVDDRLNFNQTNQSGEDLSEIKTSEKRPSDLSEKIKDHFASNWLVWVLGVLAAGILFLISDSKVTFTRIETILMTQSEKLNDLKSIDNDLQKNDRSQDLKIQENRILLDQIKEDVTHTKDKIDVLSNSQQRH